jgi:hypothetical protein
VFNLLGENTHSIKENAEIVFNISKEVNLELNAEKTVSTSVPGVE